MRDIRIGILQLNPHTLWRPGGGEIHAQKYIQHGNGSGFSVERFDFSRPGDYDIIHYFGASYQMNEFGRYALLEGIKIVGTPILYPSTNYIKYKAFLKAGRILPFPTTLQLRADLLHDSDLLIANSTPEAEYFHKAYGINPKVIRVLSTGVDEALLNFSAADEQYEIIPGFFPLKERYILMVGRVTPLKQQLQTASTIRKTTGIKVVIAGRPDLSYPVYINEIENAIANDPGIVWIRGISGAALYTLYRRALCHVLMSLTEVAALVNMEAGALECPIICRAHPTSVSILGGHALFVKKEAMLQNAIQKIVAWSEAERKAVTSAAKEFIRQHYTWEHIVGESQELYKSLLS